MKRSLTLALIAASFSVLAAPAFADGAPYYPTSAGTSTTSSSTGAYHSSLSRAQVRAQLVQSERDGSLARLDRTTYLGR